MTPSVIVAELSTLGVSVHSTGPDRLMLTSVSGNVPSQAVELARDHKAVLLDCLALQCVRHNNMANYIDVPASGGRIRTTCRVCGRFIGYRPEVTT